MGERTKYDLFMEELTSLEKQVYFLVQKNRELADNIIEFSKTNKNLEKENEVLKLKIEELETKSAKSSSHNTERNNKEDFVFNKDLMKKQIEDLVNKIDFHLSS